MAGGAYQYWTAPAGCRRHGGCGCRRFTLRMTTAGRIACSARQLVASIDGSRRKRNTAGNSLAKCLAKRLASSNGGGASIRRPSRGLESAAEHVETAPGQFAVLAAVPHVQAGLEDRLDLRAPGTVGVVFLQCLGAAEQVIDATLVQRVLVTTGTCRSSRTRRRP